MKEKPILFSPHMVGAIIKGNKTQTRRAIKPQPDIKKISENEYSVKWDKGRHFFFGTGDMKAIKDKWLRLPSFCPYGKPGDELWVRETFSYTQIDGLVNNRIYYKAGNNPFEINDPIWRPCIHMPRWASRIQLLIRDIRIEQVQDISEGDAEAEGVFYDLDEHAFPPFPARDAFSMIWDNINLKRGLGWDINPWVWVIDFEVIKGGLS